MSRNKSILIVEDEIIIAEDLKSSLESFGYSVVKISSSGEDAVEKCQKLHPDIVMMDIKLKGDMTGIDAAKIISERYQIPIIFSSAHADEKTVIQALQADPFGFLVKPYDKITLRTVIQTAFHQAIVVQELSESNKKLHNLIIDIIEALMTTIEKRDPYTADHQIRVSELASAIARELNLPKDKIECIRLASLIHDIGKIQIPSEILNKPGKLTNLEYELIKPHPKDGYDILKEIEFPCPIAQIVLEHHERLDGTGYPNKLDGKSILLEAKILAVADVVEAMSSHRPYRPSLGIAAALQEISKNKGIFYDETSVNACLSLFNEKGFVFDKQNSN